MMAQTAMNVKCPIRTSTGTTEFSLRGSEQIWQVKQVSECLGRGLKRNPQDWRREVYHLRQSAPREGLSCRGRLWLMSSQHSWNYDLTCVSCCSLHDAASGSANTAWNWSMIDGRWNGKNFKGSGSSLIDEISRFLREGLGDITRYFN